MIGKSVTIVRVRPDLHRTYTTVGVVVDTLTEESTGLVKGVAVDGIRDDSTPVHSWFAVGPDGLDGSLVTEQTCTVMACGHPIYGCRCGMGAAEAPETEHTCAPGIQYGCDVPDCDGDTD